MRRESLTYVSEIDFVRMSSVILGDVFRYSGRSENKPACVGHRGHLPELPGDDGLQHVVIITAALVNIVDRPLAARERKSAARERIDESVAIR